MSTGIYSQQGNGAKTVSNVRISYNIFDNIGCSNTDSKGWGVKFAYEGGDDVISNIDILNNVFIAATIKSTMWGISLPLSGVASNVRIRNNIINGFDYTPIYGNGSAGSIDILSVENNLFYGNGNSNSVLYIIGLVQNNNNTQNNLIADPLFLSYSDFSLQQCSPAINMGINTGLTTDILRHPIVGLPDIGSYEYYVPYNIGRCKTSDFNRN